MPQVKKYESKAEKQRAYRARKGNAGTAMTATVTIQPKVKIERISDDDIDVLSDYGIPKVKPTNFGSPVKRCKVCGIQNFWKVCRRVSNPYRWYAISKPDFWTRNRRLSALISSGRVYHHEWARFSGDVCEFCKKDNL